MISKLISPMDANLQRWMLYVACFLILMIFIISASICVATFKEIGTAQSVDLIIQSARQSILMTLGLLPLTFVSALPRVRY